MNKLAKITRNPQTRAIIGASLLTLPAVAGSAYHVANLTDTIVTAGTNVPEMAIESTAFMVDGQAYVISLVPAGVRAKIIVGGLLLVVCGALGYYLYKWRIKAEVARRVRLDKAKAMASVDNAVKNDSGLNGHPHSQQVYTAQG